MSAAERLKAMEKGEIVEGAPLFRGLIDHPVEVLCTNKSEKGALTLDLQFMGIRLGAVGGKVSDEGKIIWAEAK
jgi:hypothetical protein